MQSKEMFKKSQAKNSSVKIDISSFYVELQAEFLPEPLILTILLDSKTPQAHHIFIEKNQKTKDPELTRQIRYLLFGEIKNKGYDWMVSFLGLMDTIKLQRGQNHSQEVVMAQYMLKMLTIFTNILVTNLIDLQLQRAKDGEQLGVIGFVQKLVHCLTQDDYQNIISKLHQLDAEIPTSTPRDSISKNACSYGCSLLKEFSFKYLTYGTVDVADQKLKLLLLEEYATIINSQIQATLQYEQIKLPQEANQKQREDLFNAFFKERAKKMNFKMMLLTDCIAIFKSKETGEPLSQHTVQERDDLVQYIKFFGEVIDIKSIAYHDIAQLSHEG